MKNEIRLQVYLSKCGIGSRRGCEKYILDGRVSVNGRTVTEMGIKVTGKDNVRFDGKKINLKEDFVYIALNKPRGYLCTNHDKKGRPIALDLLKRATKQRIFHVGRLDYNSCGLIFYTNDGDFSEIVSHPSYSIEKEYYIEASRIIPENLLISYKKGILIENIRYSLKDYKIINEKTAILTLLEGKNREIRKVFRSFNIFLKKIIRKRIGIVKLSDFPAGKYRYLSDKEVKWFFNKRAGNKKE